MMMGGGGEVEGMGLGVMAALPLQLTPTVAISSGDHLGGPNSSTVITNNGGGGLSSSIKKDDRIPQWGFTETKEFIAIRAELEKDFTQTKRNKTLWELISSRMKEKGFRRSSEQCKCKWKNLVNRYKGKETSDPENGRQCPFFDELHAIFTERANTMQRLMLESEGGNSQPKKKLKRLKGLQGEKSSDEYSDDEEDEEEDSEDERIVRNKKRKADRERQRVTAEKSRANSMQEVLQDFFQQQQRIEIQWREYVERREQERRLLEQDWRQAVDKLERERILMEQAWREREEQRRVREEGRAEKRDALLHTLLNRLIREDL